MERLENLLKEVGDQRSSMEMETINLQEFPEGCISKILSLTTPVDAIRSSTISKLFHSAADSDSLWEHFLPSDYQHIISTSTTPSLSFPSKKELYFSLCDSPILVDHGTKSFRLDKASGKKCYMVGARALSMAWIDDPRYWFWASDSNSRFDDVACLRRVNWFDITGHLETRILSPYTTYGAYLVFKFGPEEYGFEGQLFKSYVTVVGQWEVGGATDQTNFNPVYFRSAGSAIRRYTLPLRNMQLVREEEDVWMEIEMGEFTVGNEDETSLVRMLVREVEVLYTKSGIIIEGIEVRPK